MPSEMTVEQARAWLDSQDPIVCPTMKCVLPRASCAKRVLAARKRYGPWYSHIRSLPSKDQLDVCWSCEEGERNSKRVPVTLRPSAEMETSTLRPDAHMQVRSFHAESRAIRGGEY
jgi:hypothetical protein